MSAPAAFSVLHLSDLHFGRVKYETLQSLKDFITHRPEKLDLVILTGDLTQRAKKEQFVEARQFLESLPCPVFVVPGNHDVPLYNIFLRFFSPYKRYQKYMGDWTKTYYEDDRVAVVGLWTVNNWRIQEGRLSSRQVKEACEKFQNVKPGKVKILAFHHPVLTTSDKSQLNLVKKVLEMKPDIMLWGHDHHSHAEYFDALKKELPLLVAAGTTISSRTRKETNSFNWIGFSKDQIEVRTYCFSEENGKFENQKSKYFKMSDPITAVE